MFTLPNIDRRLLWQLVLFHTCVIAISNYLVTFPVKFWGIHVTWAAFTFPLVVVATDLTVRLIGKNPARAVVALAFIPAIIASVAVVYATGAPASVAVRIGIASGTAYLVSNLMDVFVFQKIRERWQMWFVQCLPMFLIRLLSSLWHFIKAPMCSWQKTGGKLPWDKLEPRFSLACLLYFQYMACCWLACRSY